MAYQESTYAGDDEYAICCTGDAVKGDQVRFEKAVFTGSYRRPKFSHFTIVTGEIVTESYGFDKQQHTFTIHIGDGHNMRIKGRNLYKNGVWRKPWSNEEDRKKVVDEKHERGDAARKARDIRREEKGYF